MPEKQYRLTITYKRTRPYTPLPYIHHVLSRPGDGYHQDEVDEIGVPQQLVIGPYSRASTVKQQRGRALDSYPLANIWGDDELGYEILEEKWEVGEVTTIWSDYAQA